jgi:hypothetical protein
MSKAFASNEEVVVDILDESGRLILENSISL